MHTNNTLRATRSGVAAVLLVLAVLAGCGKQQPAQDAAAATAFDTPEAAVGAFVAALEKNDLPRLQALLGPGAGELLDSGDAVQDAGDRAGFLAAYKAKNSLVDDGADRKVLVVGDQDWPLPIPLVKRDGKLVFDG